MFREQIVNFLETTVVFLLITNVLSVAAATRAMQLLNAVATARREPGLIERKPSAILHRAP
jgi:hypothetical protein